MYVSLSMQNLCRYAKPNERFESNLMSWLRQHVVAYIFKEGFHPQAASIPDGTTIDQFLLVSNVSKSVYYDFTNLNIYLWEPFNYTLFLLKAHVEFGYFWF